METPLPFITWESDSDEPIVNEEAARIISSYQKPLFVVSIVGTYRTGKSFLMNRLMGRNDGFPLGPTIMSETKGIWMWIRDHPWDDNKALLLLDTEGLNDAHKGDKNHDAQIFTLAILLCSVLVFNSQGRIDDSALDGIRLAGELTEHIKGKGNSGEDFAQFFPSLIWAIRDFTLELKMDGNDITEDEYLESCLKVAKGRGLKVTTFNEIRLSIREFFPDRHCIVFPSPTTPDRMTKLDTMEFEDLEPTFKDAAQKFEDKVLNINRVKTVENKPVVGSSYLALVREYCSLISSGFINIMSAHENLILNVNGNAVQEAKALFEAEMSLNLAIPASEMAFEATYKAARESAMDFFISKVISIEKHPKYLEDLNDAIKEFAAKTDAENRQCSYDKTSAILYDLYAPLEEGLQNNQFLRPGGSKEFDKMVDQLLLDFENIAKSEELGPAKDRALDEFLKSKINPIRKNLTHSDQALSKKEKEKKEAEIRAEEAQRDRETAEKERQEIMKRQDELQKVHVQEMQSFQREMEDRRRLDLEKLQTQLENERKESARLIAEGREEEARLRREQTELYQQNLESQQKEAQMREDRFMAKTLEMQEQLVKQHQEHARQLAEMASRPVQVKRECVVM